MNDGKYSWPCCPPSHAHTFLYLPLPFTAVHMHMCRVLVPDLPGHGARCFGQGEVEQLTLTSAVAALHKLVCDEVPGQKACLALAHMYACTCTPISPYPSSPPFLLGTHTHTLTHTHALQCTPNLQLLLWSSVIYCRWSCWGCRWAAMLLPHMLPHTLDM